MDNNMFNAANKLKEYTVLINDIELVKEMITTVELSYKNSTPVIYGNLIIDDLFDMNQQVDWLTAIITISYTDLFDVKIDKKFRVIQINEFKHNLNKKGFDLRIQDAFSYKLERSFLSKGFNGKITTALKSYITELGLSDYVLEITDTVESTSFIVPKNVNNLDFFINALKKEGYTFYQTKDAICVKSLAELSFSNLEEEVDEFTDETDNQYYMNKIIDFTIIDTDKLNVKPKIRSFAYNPTTKTIEKNIVNDATLYALNDNPDNVLDNDGYMDYYQQHLNFNDHALRFKDSILQQNKIEMVVYGYAKNSVNKIYNLFLRGNMSTTESQTSGDVTNNGRYVATKVIHKIVGDSLIQKIFLSRADSQSRG